MLRKLIVGTFGIGLVLTAVTLFAGDSTRAGSTTTVTTTDTTTVTVAETPSTSLKEATTTTMGTATTATTTPVTTTTTEADLAIPDEVPVAVQTAVDSRGEDLGRVLFESTYSGNPNAVPSALLGGAAAEMSRAFGHVHTYDPTMEIEWEPSGQGIVYEPFVVTTPLGSDRYLAKGLTVIAHPMFAGAITTIIVEYDEGTLTLLDYTLDPLPFGDAAYWVSELVLHPDLISPRRGGQVADSEVVGEGLAGWLNPPRDPTLFGDDPLSTYPKDTWTVSLMVRWSEPGGSPFSDFAEDNSVKFLDWSEFPSDIYGSGVKPALEDGEPWMAPMTVLYHVWGVPEANLRNDGAGLSAGLDPDGYLARHWVVVESPGVPWNVCDELPELCPDAGYFLKFFSGKYVVSG